MTDQAVRDHRLELAATLLLALAAIATAWASYQSSRWHGKQAEAQSASIAARVESTKDGSVANRQVQVDLALFTQWIDAYAKNETELADFYRMRFRQEFVPAFDGWVATHPRHHPKAPLWPFAIPQYELAASTEADRLEQKAANLSQQVKTNIRRADNCLLSVVLFAVSLFFAALSTRLHEYRSRVALLTLGWLLFLGTVAWLATQPISVAV